MTKSEHTAQFILRELAKNYGRAFPEAGVKAIWPKLTAETPEAMEAAFDAIVLGCAYLPSPEQLLARVQTEGKKLRAAEAAQREKEWEQEKGTRRSGSIFSQEQSDEHARLSVQTIRFMLSSKPTREQKLDAFRAMENQFPGVGWGIEGARLQKEWEAQVGSTHSAAENGAGEAMQGCRIPE